MTEVIDAVVDEITFSKSAFATSVATGDVIFINARIVNAVGIDRGQRRKFIVLPNYEDKQAQGVMWRAMRVEPTFDYNNPSIPVPVPLPTQNLPAPTITKFDEREPQPRKNIRELLTQRFPMTEEEIMEETGFNSAQVKNAMKSLMAYGQAMTITTSFRNEMTVYYSDKSYSLFDEEE
jgi:hypothetical protein